MNESRLMFQAICQLAQVGEGLAFNIYSGMPSTRKAMEDALECFKLIQHVGAVHDGGSMLAARVDRIMFAMGWLISIRKKWDGLLALPGPNIPGVEELELTLKACQDICEGQASCA